MPEPANDYPLTVKISHALRAKIEDYRRAQKVIPSMAEAARMMLEKAAETEGPRP